MNLRKDLGLSQQMVEGIPHSPFAAEDIQYVAEVGQRVLEMLLAARTTRIWGSSMCVLPDLLEERGI